MSFQVLTITSLCWILVATSAIRKEQEENRVFNKELSDVEHDADGDHNSIYDHEAFLGREEAEEFDELSPEESKKRLGDIVDKIDTDKDGNVSEDEMIAWIRYIQRSYVSEDAKRQWSFYSKSETDSLTWDEYAERSYGKLPQENSDEDQLSYSDLRTRDKRRFEKADANTDGTLSFNEFIDFLHPEDAEHMREVVVAETMEDIDKNKDNVIDEKEYIGDMWTDGDSDEEPEWVKTEREHFRKWRDLNDDGVMDADEVRHWIMPDDYDHAQAESRHLIYEADTDKDGKLSKEEIIEKYDLFVGSQATDFGEALGRSHDEF